jgi:DDE_Tnp_1-associated/Transposase DDE domain
MALSLVERLAELTDPRDRRGLQYPMVGLLTLCLVAILAGHTGPESIAHFGRLRQRRLGHALGFKNGKMPCANTITALLRGLDADHLDRIIGAWLTDRRAHGWEHIALDGKRLCGSRDGEVPGTHLLAAYAPQASAVIAQMTVEASTNEHKAALRLLDVLPPLGGTVVTADAMFTHADVCAKVQRKGGDYILYAKKNQPELRDDLEATFAAAERGDFSPGTPGPVGAERAGRNRTQQGPRARGAADDHHDDVAQRVLG